MTPTKLVLTAIVALAAFGHSSTNAKADEYPWCVQGSALHCYYSNRAQCEEAVDFHGFCVSNPDYTAGNRRNVRE